MPFWAVCGPSVGFSHAGWYSLSLKKFSPLTGVLLRFCGYLFLGYLTEPPHIRVTMRHPDVPQPRHLATHLVGRERVEDCRQGGEEKLRSVIVRQGRCFERDFVNA